MTTKATNAVLEATVKQQQDEINGLKAIAKALLTTTMGSPLQAQLKFDSLMIENTAEAVANREAERKVRELKDNAATIAKEYRDRKASQYWLLVFMSEEERTAYLDSLWSELAESVELPKGCVRPSDAFIMPNDAQLIDRKVELEAVINRANPTQAKHDIEFCEGHLKTLKKQKPDANTRDEMNRYSRSITNAKIVLQQLEQNKAELGKVKVLLAEVLTA
jgi:hypothetical protein